MDQKHSVGIDGSGKNRALVHEATGKSAEGEGFKMWRAMEMRGTSMSDPEGTSRLANSLAQNMAKRGGVSYAHADPKFIAGPLSVVAADLGGDTTGTALQSLYQFTSGATVMSKQQGKVLADIGMLDPTKVHNVGGSDKLNMDPGAMKGWQLAMRDPYEWVQKYLLPHLKETYGDDKDKISAAIAKLGRNRNVTRMLTMFSDPGFLEQIEKDISQWSQSSAIDKAYSDAMARNPAMIKKAFGDQYDSMMQSLGAPMMQAAIPGMKCVTEMFTSIGGWANANPETIKNIGVGVAGLAVIRREVARNMYPTSAPFFDGSRHWSPPDSGLQTT